MPHKYIYARNFCISKRDVLQNNPKYDILNFVNMESKGQKGK